MTDAARLIKRREYNRQYRRRRAAGEPTKPVGRPRKNGGNQDRQDDDTPRCPECGEVISVMQDCRCP